MLKEKLLEDLKECMKTKNEIRKNTVQMVRAAILQIEKDKQITVEDSQIIDIIAKECKKIFEYTGKINDIMEQTSEDKWHIDTILINRILFKNLGLKEENIIDSGLCSVCNSDIIHSFRVEKEGYGLATALIELT